MSDRLFGGLMVFLGILVLFSLAVGVRSWFADPRQWATLTGSLQALGGLSLVIVTLLYVKKVDAQVEATRKSAEAAEKTARANEQRARILENREREETLSRLQFIVQESSKLGVECMQHFQRIAEWTMSDEEGLPIMPPLFPDARVENLETTGSRIGGRVAGAVAEAVQSLEDADDLLKTAEVDRQHASDPDTVEIMESLKSALNSAQTACFEAATKANRQIQLVRAELSDRTRDQSRR